MVPSLWTCVNTKREIRMKEIAKRPRSDLNASEKPHYPFSNSSRDIWCGEKRLRQFEREW